MKYKGFSFRQILLVLVVVVLAMPGSSLQVRAEDGGQELAEKIAAISSKAIYNLDQDQLVAVLEGFLADRPEIRALTVTEMIDEERLMDFFQKDDAPVFNQPIPDMFLQLPKYRAFSTYENEQIGIIEIYYDADIRAISRGAEENSIELENWEKLWLVGKSPFKLGIDPSWAPFEFVDEDGMYSGISSGYVDLITSRLGIEMKPVPDLTWPDVIAKAKSGEIDVLPAVTKTPDREKYLLFTEPYISFPMVITTRKDAPFVDSLAGLEGKQVGVVKGYASQEIIEINHPGIKLVLVENLQAGLQKLGEGEMDAFVDNLLTITHEFDKSRIDNLKIASPTKYAFKLSMAVRKDLPELVPILNKVLGTIDERERASIVNSWTAIQVKYGTDLKTILVWGVPIGGVVFLVFVVVVQVNRRMSRQISERIKAENSLKAKEQEQRHTLENLSAVLESIEYGILFMDSDYHAVICNKEFLKLWGIPQDFLDGHPTVEDFIRYNRDKGVYNVADEDFDEFVEQRMASFKSGNIPPTEIVRADGKTYIYQCKQQKNGGIMLTYFDISERKADENRLSDAYGIISDSIDYAAKIQRSVLPDDTLFSSLLTDQFVLWEPRDVVGGDIYWSRMWGDGFLIILGDCTGHGVPGAFMTLIATGALDNALSDVPGGMVADLMLRLHQLVQMTLGQHGGKAESDDGMELGICYLGPEMDKLIFVGARFELYLVEDNTVNVVKGTKSGIGYQRIPFTQQFEEHEIINLDTKTFYMTSDGFLDQVGGERNRMFGKKRFRELLLEAQGMPMKDQKDFFQQTLTDFQGEQNRRDDISVIGFRV